jgi:hypothetical protein
VGKGAADVAGADQCNFRSGHFEWILCRSGMVLFCLELA